MAPLAELIQRWRVAACCSLLGLAGAVAAGEQDLADAEFLEMLEYLGSWDESDEDWLLLEAAGKAIAGLQDENRDDARNDAVPEGEQSTESDDER
jgi:hypothetical protein